jgi:hypothetical protein
LARLNLEDPKADKQRRKREDEAGIWLTKTAHLNECKLKDMVWEDMIPKNDPP